MPVVPSDRVDGDMVTVEAETVMLYALVAVVPFESTTCTVKLNVPVPVGVPLSTPVLAPRLIPAGIVPDIFDQVFDPTALVAVSV